MAITKFDHIAIVVPNLDEALTHFRQIFDVDDDKLIYERDYKDTDTKTGNVEIMHFCLFPVGEVYFEIVEPASEGPVMKFLNRTGGGIHHLGLTSDKIRDEWKKHDRLRERVRPLESKPRVDQYKVSYWFLHPKANHNVLFEIDSAWAKTSASDMTPVEKTPDWEAL